MTSFFLLVNAVAYLASAVALGSLAARMNHTRAPLILHWQAAFGSGVVGVGAVLSLIGVAPTPVGAWVLAFTWMPAVFPFAITRWYGRTVRAVKDPSRV